MNLKSMNFFSIIIFTVTFVIINGCAINKLQNKGDIENNEFHYSMDFSTAKGLVIIPAKIDGKQKSFLFDTGADLSLIQRDTLKGNISKITGASKRKVELGKEIVESIKIGTINFRNTYAWNGDLKGLKEQINNFGGIIGQPIISKANWLINYPLKRLEISNKNLVDDSYQSVEIKRKGGAPYTYITFSGIKYRVVIDLGSTSSFNIPKDSKLAKEILSTYIFRDNERERYTLGGLQAIKEKIGYLPLIKLGNMEFKNVETTINNSSQLRIGMRFFEECAIYVDNINGDYKIKKTDND